MPEAFKNNSNWLDGGPPLPSSSLLHAVPPENNQARQAFSVLASPDSPPALLSAGMLAPVIKPKGAAAKPAAAPAPKKASRLKANATAVSRVTLSCLRSVAASTAEQHSNLCRSSPCAAPHASMTG